MKNTNLRILITGGSGLVGQNLTNKLHNEGYHNVKITIHKSTPKVTYDEYEYINVDLTNYSDCLSITKDTDIVFNCAAYTTNAVDTIDNPLAHVTQNVVVNNYLIDAAHKNKVKKFIFLSSSSVYPPKGDDAVLESDFLFGETYPAYFCVGWMKRYAEVQCEMYAKYVPNPMTTIVLRPANLYGPYDKYDLNKCHVTPATIRKVAEKMNPIPIWGDGSELRDLLFIDDFIDALLLVMETQETYDTFNVSSNKVYSVNEVLEYVKNIANHHVPTEYVSNKPSMIPVRKINSDKIKNVLGWEAKTPIEEGLKITYNWFIENKHYY